MHEDHFTQQRGSALDVCMPRAKTSLSRSPLSPDALSYTTLPPCDRRYMVLRLRRQTHFPSVAPTAHPATQPRRPLQRHHAAKVPIAPNTPQPRRPLLRRPPAQRQAVYGIARAQARSPVVDAVQQRANGVSPKRMQADAREARRSKGAQQEGYFALAMLIS